MKRRTFIRSSAVAALGSTIGINNIIAAGKSYVLQKERIFPDKLKKGDTIGIVAPGSFITVDELAETIVNIEHLGFKTFYTKKILSRTGYLAGSDSERAEDFNKMFADKKVKGIMAARGGYGCTRILPLLNYESIKNNPKILIGYSDITALINVIYEKTGLICFHGPVGISTFNNFTIDYFNQILIKGRNNVELIPSKENSNKPDQIPITIRSGVAEGKLVGGNLSIIVSMIGTPYDINTGNKIVFLEDVGEEPYRIDRMLTQMLEAGKFNNVKGIALGIFKNCDVKKDSPEFESSFTLLEVIYDRLFKLKIPIIYGLSFGHIINKFTLPIGVRAKLDTINQKITLLEKAVI